MGHIFVQPPYVQFSVPVSREINTNTIDNYRTIAKSIRSTKLCCTMIIDPRLQGDKLGIDLGAT